MKGIEWERDRSSKLQWGRAHVSAEITSAVSKRTLTHWASMGPRSRERGNQAATNQAGDALRASMGPRSRERGNQRIRADITIPRLASMGPRSRERGNNLDLSKEDAQIRASMGPRSRERGNRSRLCRRRSPLPSFNGAALT